MMAEEIRADLAEAVKIFRDIADKNSLQQLSVKTMIAQMNFLAEIAAQLAELNAALRTDKAIVIMPVPQHTKEATND